MAFEESILFLQIFISNPLALEEILRSNTCFWKINGCKLPLS